MYNLKAVHEAVEEGKYGEAFRILEQLRERYPEFGFYAETALEIENRLEAALSSLQDTVLSDPAADIEVFVGRAVELATIGNTETARKFLDPVCHSERRSPWPLLALAKIDLMERKFADALDKAKYILSVMDSKCGLACSMAYRIAGLVCIELEDFGSASHYFLNKPEERPDQLTVITKNPDLPDNFVIPMLKGSGNDYTFILEKVSVRRSINEPYELKASIIIPTYNRDRFLANTLAALTHQTYPGDLLEVVVVDDGSSEDTMRVIRKYEKLLNLFYVRQKDAGYRAAAARNLGIRASTGDVAIFVDDDTMLFPKYVEAYMEVMHVTDKAVLLGHRSYVDVSNIDDDSVLSDIECISQLPSINKTGDKSDVRDSRGESIDWRFPRYEETDYLKTDIYPFMKASSVNMVVPKKLIEACGVFDEEFRAWGCEDQEYAYRLYNAGAYFIPMTDVNCLHQEPVYGYTEDYEWIDHEIARKVFRQKCPALKVRGCAPDETFSVPKVSIYMPAYNAERYIVDAVNSCLEQDFKDLEICICNDGSTDETLYLLEKNFGRNDRVRWITQENRGIAHAATAAINLCRGMYIGQLDADDLLKQGAIRACVDALDSSKVDAVYTDSELIDSENNRIRDHWCNGDYNRHLILTRMVATHFRMFRRRVWNRIKQDDLDLSSAADFDIWSRISEVADIANIHEVLYQYRIHYDNTSIIGREQQRNNHGVVIERALERMRLDRFWRVQPTVDLMKYDNFRLDPVINLDPPDSSEIVVLIPCCMKNEWKIQAARTSWVKSFLRMGFRCFFLLGDPALVSARLDGDTIYVPCGDDYEHFFLKLTLGYGFLYRNFEFDYLLKVDDDCYPNILKFLEIVIPQLRGSQYYGGCIHNRGEPINATRCFGKCGDKRFEKEFHTDKAPVSYAMGERGYILRRDVLPLFIEKQVVFEGELARFEYCQEDMRVAEELHRFGIYVTQLDDYVADKADDEIRGDWTVVYDVNSRECFRQLSMKNQFQL